MDEEKLDATISGIYRDFIVQKLEQTYNDEQHTIIWQKRINEAIEKVAMFQAQYAEYAQNPEITRSRMYYEAISDILPGVKLFVNTGTGDKSDVQMLLPLDQLMDTTGGND